MTALVGSTGVSPLPLPSPRVEIRIRAATMDDLPSLDALQKLHTRQLGYFPTKQFQSYIETGGVLVAEETMQAGSETRDEGLKAASDQHPSPIGYLISRDRYLKRDELGVIYQLCVAPGQRRKLVAASLLKAAFDRSAYGCRLYCCWCAQDLEANAFWESMGFVPLAFRGGSGKKGRVHIFWQKRIREGDTTTPWWFPAKTEGGAMREDRLVLPIPPYLHWSDEMPVLKPRDAKVDKRHPRPAPAPEPAPVPRQKQVLQFGPPPEEPVVTPPVSTPEPTPKAKAPREKAKCDPKFIAAARELRDRYLEQVNTDQALLLPEARYDLTRALPATLPAALPAA